MRINTTVGAVASVGGRQYAQPPGVLVDERVSRFARGRSRGSLYILGEAWGPAAERDVMADQLAQIVRDLYYEWRGSVTAGLQHALREANNLLFNENRNSLPGEQWTAGLTCAVLRDGDLFIAQAGPAAAYLRQQDEVTRIPDVSPWLDGLPPEELDAAALGERRDLNVTLFHVEVNTGDTLLLLQSEAARLVPPQRWPIVLSGDSVGKIVDDLIEASQGSDLSALVLKLSDDAVEVPVAAATTGGAAPVAATAPTQATQERPSPAPPSTLNQVSDQIEEFQLGERLQAAWRALVAVLAGLWAALLGFVGRLVPSQSGSQPASGGKTTAVKSGESKPKKRPKAKRATQPPSDLVQKILIGVAITIPIIVAVVVLFTVIQRGQTHRAEVETLWQQANGQWQQAQTTTDPAQARTRLNEAMTSLNALIDLRPDHAEAEELRKRVEARLDEINQVKRVSWVGELNAYPANAALSRVVVEGTHIFVMDRHNGKVYHHQLDDLQQALQPNTRETVLVSKGDQVGNVLVSDLVDMVWMPAGNGRQKANLVILESGGSLLEYDPTTKELRPLPVAASETWQYPKLVSSYYGRFYLLDSTANKIWRYTPTVDGYSALPDEWLKEPVDLAGVMDMAIGDSIYLLYADGKMRKLSAGQPDAFDISDWDAPPRSPSALFTRPPEETKWIYVADRGNSRIEQSGKDGRFKRQFQLADLQVAQDSDPLASVTSLFVDEISGHAYFSSNQRLYLIILPD